MDANSLMPFLGGIAVGFIFAAIIFSVTRKKGDDGAARPDSVQLLGSLQEKGRLIDFLMEEIKDYDDSQIGAAVRNIHQDCQKLLKEYFPLKQVVDAKEDSEFVVNEGFDPSKIKLTGNVGSKPPFKGIVRHSGWMVSEVKMPVRPSNIDKNVVAPAEVEIS
ncbi:MAG TPA: DUF2760 domain-containing protein [Candidatus Wallbacteria bacterium]|nr:MAG: hypothetical protein BWY32_03627 [bacterium ADurb.Bin243]HOD40856.1 DUF2760 domain-containing protein [Candidatus Wallbacteria bacterium]HPG58793.1 DUF2760 domain-containing protein [Candidatus Wallbacteria bacterium]